VGQLAALLALCDGFVGNDSGAMHVAAALGVPTVGIFGSTRPDRTAPLGARTAVVSHPIECSPCMQRTCRFGHYDCLGQVTVDRVRAALESAIGPGG
jgi:heptosyltransferase-2